MCRPLLQLVPFEYEARLNYRRPRLTRHIVELLQRSCRYEALVRQETFTKLAMKLERMLIKAYPAIDQLTEEQLVWKLRHIVRRLLKSKDCVALQPNNYAEAT
ncbi:hypothetical protein THRCLA_20708 [Thraustotheca clavata]|uniref:Uncharacterized protein n=1 Tax=Thraustotheca clavata TaxID=74557 RepID=A0A1W0A4J3_9STRA|nr:hypothetical protein THRCLA_20708 [Thraustotheca clavata]